MKSAPTSTNLVSELGKNISGITCLEIFVDVTWYQFPYLWLSFFKYCSNFKSQISSNIMPRCDFKPQISNIIPQMCDITAFNFIQRLRVKVWILDPGPKCSQGVRRPGVQTVQLGLISGIFQSIWGHNRWPHLITIVTVCHGVFRQCPRLNWSKIICLPSRSLTVGRAIVL